MQRIKYYLLASIISLAVVFAVFWRFKIDFNLPLNYSGDAIVHYNFAKNIQQTGWWARNPNFGLPTGQTLYDFPLTENTQLLLIKTLITLGLDWMYSVNWYYILTFPLIAVVSLYCFTRMGLKYQIALPLSIVYTVMPYHFLRGINHLFLSGYFVVPLAILLAYSLALEKKFNRLEYAILVIFIASSGAYYTYFSVVILSAVTAILMVKDWPGRKWIEALIAVAIVIFIFSLNYLPTFLYTQKNGDIKIISERPASDTEYYGLKITQLILPFEDHNLKLFNKVQKKYISEGTTTLNENQYAALGLVASLGFGFLLVWTLVRPKIRYLDKNDNASLDLLGTLNLTLVLFGNVGGFATIISTYFTPVFRSVNRVSIFIAFIALFALGILINKLKPQKATIVAWIILLFAIWDQVSIGVVRNFMVKPEKYQQLVTYTEEIEAKTNDGGKIFTLPVGEYPEGADKNFMSIALLTDDIQWTSGAENLRKANLWQKELEQGGIANLVTELRNENFAGLLVNLKLTAVDDQLQLNSIFSDRFIEDRSHTYRYYFF
jgi:hypothetical protein